MATATARQIDANRQNARHSTGPVTDAGKAASRKNALIHGLAGAGIVLAPDEADEVERRCAEWAAVFRPVNVIEAFHVRQYAVESVRLERCQAQERELMDRRARRAVDPIAWDEDRRLEAEEVGAHLARHPSRTARRLRQTAQGCDWLIARWRGLLAELQGGTPWGEKHRALALDLLGTPRDLRAGATPADPDLDAGDGHDPCAPQRALAVGRIAELERLRDEVLLDRDEEDREAAVAGAEEGGGSVERSLRLVRRYEAACHRRLHVAMEALLGTRSARIGRPSTEHFHPAAKAVAGAPNEPVATAAEPEPEPSTELVSPAETPDAPAGRPSPTSPDASPDRPRGNRRHRRAQARLARRGSAA